VILDENPGETFYETSIVDAVQLPYFLEVTCP
jgi:hypothetical protein